MTTPDVVPVLPGVRRMATQELNEPPVEPFDDPFTQ
jgi:hypothetical protein